MLRFDDTNPSNESDEYTQAILNDIAWLGYDVKNNTRFSSDYFDQIYSFAVHLIKNGHAYVCSLNPDEVRKYRGTLTEKGKESPYRDRSIDENLDLFERMKKGEFKEGQHSLRAKIDMSAGNINLRDPMLYRIKYVSHHRQGNKWCIYPMYDFTHPISDAIEGITHSLCTLEFQDHRPLYDWVIENCDIQNHPQQIEFSRLNLNYTITSKRKLKSLVDQKQVTGWDDPRMPTISGLRRRGVTATSIKDFCDTVGISKQDSVIDISILEEAVRNDLNKVSARRMGVLDPIKVLIKNLEADEILNVPNHPQNESYGRRDMPFSNVIYIDREDFMENPTPGFHRLKPNGRARLMFAYVIECVDVIKDTDGNISELHCNYLPETKGGKKPEGGGKIKGIIHWVCAKSAINADVHLYDRLFEIENPAKNEDVLESLNSKSVQVITNAKLEPSLQTAKVNDKFQFNRLGYFCVDSINSNNRQVFNRTVTLRDVWHKKK
jgi:glutaminyl-tRNA synthetase